LHIEEGRIVRSGTANTYEYLLKDHPGNNRSGFKVTTAGRASFRSDYYPFGLQNQQNIVVGSPENKYLYNGKELQKGTGMLDYGARQYDPVIGRWNVVDPLAEKYQVISPYVYVANSPLNFIDRDGRDIYIPISKGDFAKKAFSQLQSLTSQPLVLLNTGQVVAASRVNRLVDNISLIGRLSNSPVKKDFGTSLVGEILDNKNYTVTIVSDGGWGEMMQGDYGPTGKATIRHDVENPAGQLVNADGSKGASPQSALGHELIHVKHYIDGSAKENRDDVKVKDPDGLNSSGKLSKEEIRTRKKENLLRREQLDKDRAIPTIIQ